MNHSECSWKTNNTTTNSTFYYKDKWDFGVLPSIIISIYSVNILLAFPLNIYVIVLLLPRHGLIDPSSIFSLNQAAVEIFFAVLGPFHSLCKVNLELCFFKIVGFLLGTSMSSRCAFQCCVCLERYLAVVHPVTFLRYKPVRYRVACSIVTWMGSVAIGIFSMCTYPDMPFTAFGFLFLLVLTVDVFCCTAILKRLKHPGPQDMESNSSDTNAAKNKAFQVVSITLLIFLIQNIPIGISFGIKSNMSAYAFSVVVMISLAINTITGFFQPAYVLYKAGNHVSCIRSAPPKSTEHCVVS